MKQKVYLAGGFNSDWRNKLKNITGFEFFVPVKKENARYEEYGAWDLHYLNQCDICFVYMSKDNPSGFGLSVEIGYARGKDKTVIFVLEDGHEKEAYLQFLKATADVVYNDLNKGIKFLKTFR